MYNTSIRAAWEVRNPVPFEISEILSQYYFLHKNLKHFVIFNFLFYTTGFNKYLCMHQLTHVHTV